MAMTVEYQDGTSVNLDASTYKYEIFNVMPNIGNIASVTASGGARRKLIELYKKFGFHTQDVSTPLNEETWYDDQAMCLTLLLAADVSIKRARNLAEMSDW